VAVGVAMPPKVGRTMKAAFSAKVEGFDRFIKPGELVDVKFGRGQSPSLVARRTLALLIGEAAGDAWKDTTHRIPKKCIRQAHKSNERLSDTLDEVASILMVCETISSRGRAAISRSGLFEDLIEETEDSDGAWIEYRFNAHARRLFGASEHYAAMNSAALFAFNSKYAVTLYELGCLYSGRRDPSVEFTMPELRERLGIEKGRYKDYAQLKRRVFDQAKLEIDHLAHFTFNWVEVRHGRKIVRVRLQFWKKTQEEIDSTADECERPKVGRKARRDDTAEKIIEDGQKAGEAIQSSLWDALGLDLDDHIPH